MSQHALTRTRITYTIAILGFVLVAIPVATADPAEPYLAKQETKIVPDALGEKDEFTRAMDVDREHIVLGNWRGGEGGQVYVYERTGDGPELEATLASEHEQTRFGTAVALDGSTLVVGDPGVDTAGTFSAGAVYVYEETSEGDWTRTDTLVSNQPGAIDHFGKSVAVEGELVVVGEPEDELPGEGESNGAVHVFEQGTDTYAHVQKLEPPADEDRERLGVHLEVANGVIYAGANRDEHPTDDPENEYPQTGSVFLYHEQDGEWTQQATLAPPADTGSKHFGVSFDVVGDTVLVGAPGPDNQICCGPLLSGPQGNAFVYTRTDDGFEHQQLDPLLATSGSRHGASVALEDGKAFVSAPNAPRDEKYGTVSVFERSGDEFEQTGQVLARDGEKLDQLGAAIAVEGDTLLASAPWRDSTASRAGAVYVFEEASLGLASTPDAAASSTCRSPSDQVRVCDDDDSPDPEEVTVRLEAPNLGEV